MAIQVRRYTDSDLVSIQDALARWIQDAGTCGYCHVGGIPHRIIQARLAAYPIEELIQIWQEQHQIIGIAINFRFETAFDLFVAPQYRGTATELAMLEATCATTQGYVDRLGQPAACVTSDVFREDYTRIQLLQRLRFEEFRTWDWITERSLSETIPEAQLPDGFSIRSATLADYVQLAAAHSDAFNDTWTAEQYRDVVMLKPGYDPDNQLIVVDSADQIAAFTIMYVDQLNKVSLFEPVGTCTAYRRLGLARALLLYGMQCMWHAGMRQARIEHDATNIPARELYRGLGFQKQYETCGYRRRMPVGSNAVAR